MLKDVLPLAFPDGGYQHTLAYTLRDEPVVQERYGSEWIGPETGIHSWFVLENGYAVAIDKRDGADPFPTYKMPPKPIYNGHLPRLVVRPTNPLKRLA
jgi:hypothetical protein